MTIAELIEVLRPYDDDDVVATVDYPHYDPLPIIQVVRDDGYVVVRSW